MATQWTCPYCARPCTIDDNDIRIMSDYTRISKEYGYYRSELTIIVCPNPECRQKTISLKIKSTSQNGYEEGPTKHKWNLLPESQAKPFPDYIPKPLIDDYNESCLIKDKSPKASATLSRRCLQGIIRDFWNIKKGRLTDEINELKPQIDSEIWEAIDSVRQVGNIGAHMEKDVDLIINVDPDEADLLIGLIETLFEEWYIKRHDRKTKMAALKQLADDKKSAKQKILKSQNSSVAGTQEGT